jgi:hypothetical protein
MSTWETLQKQIDELTEKRDEALCEVRKRCKHLRLAELESHPPRRMCLDCGAEEDGWGIGYQALAMAEDCTSLEPHKAERGSFLRTSDSDKFFQMRKPGPLYLVGQSAR